MCAAGGFVRGFWKSAVWDGSDGPRVVSETFTPGGFRRLEQHMQLGAFSLSLAVKDIAASAAFYEKLGFTRSGGEIDQNWLILRNGQTVIGLFQGMFEKNSLTFNPGWNQDAQQLDSFTDVRDLQRQLKDQGIPFVAEAGDGTGPGSFIVVDPDGNPVIVDQHV
jgi:lactoylglutathione lyase